MSHAGERFDDGWGMIEGGVACYLQVRDVGGVGGVFFTLVELRGKTRLWGVLLPYCSLMPTMNPNLRTSWMSQVEAPSSSDCTPCP